MPRKRGIPWHRRLTLSAARGRTFAVLTVLGAVALAAVLLKRPLPAGLPDPSTTLPRFAGSASCKSCHEPEYEKWKGSHHERAMDVATEATVLGEFDNRAFTSRGVTTRFFRRDEKFMVSTEGADGKTGEFEVSHTFGVWPLQQYLVPLPGGRRQSLTVAWDVEAKHWFSLYPDQDIPPTDWLHWTRHAQNWNGMCAECHSTNLEKNYDPTTDTYQTTWSEISVGCEACHGPGTRHIEWATRPAAVRPSLSHQGLTVATSNITASQLVDQCAPCHSRRAELGDHDHSGARLLDYALPSLLDEGLYFPDGQQQDEVYVYGSFLQSRMYASGVKCSDCHDSHSGKLLQQGNALCLQCHAPEVFDRPSHHFHQPTVAGQPSAGALCVKCHMPERTYMQVDARADHSLRVPRPDLSVALGVPNACSQVGCHADKPMTWAAAAFRRWYGSTQPPHFGTTFAAARAAKPGADADLLQIADSPQQPAIVRATALSLLARYLTPSADAALQRALASGDPLLREAAVVALGPRPAPQRRDLLASLLMDPVKAVRLEAVMSLADVPAAELDPQQREARARGFGEYVDTMSRSLDFASSGLNLGNLFHARGQVAEAEKYYRRALRVDSLFSPAKTTLAVLLSGQGRNSEAERLLREVVSQEPRNIDAVYSLGLLLAEMGKRHEALAYLQEAAGAAPANARLRYNLGLLLQQVGRRSEAERALSTALRLEPANPDFLLALADYYVRHGRAREALPLAERLIHVAPENPVGRRLKAEISAAGR